MSNQLEFLEEQIKKTASMVARWQGHRARMLELTTSHASPTILVGDETYGRNLLIACLGPLHICGPVQWESSTISLEVVSLDSGEAGIVVVDEPNGVRIVAESFEVKENVKW